MSRSKLTRSKTGKSRTKPSLTSFSGSLIPRESSKNRAAQQKHQYYNTPNEQSVHSPSNLNKSVSFSRSVKVREFPTNSNRQKSSSRKVKNTEQALPPRRLQYEQSPAASRQRDEFSSGRASSARQHYCEPPSQYQINGGSPLVSKRHGSVGNLHQPSPGRGDLQSHNSSQFGGRGQSYEAVESNQNVVRSSAV